MAFNADKFRRDILQAPTLTVLEQVLEKVPAFETFRFSWERIFGPAPFYTQDGDDMLTKIDSIIESNLFPESKLRFMHIAQAVGFKYAQLGLPTEVTWSARGRVRYSHVFYRMGSYVVFWGGNHSNAWVSKDGIYKQSLEINAPSLVSKVGVLFYPEVARLLAMERSPLHVGQSGFIRFSKNATKEKVSADINQLPSLALVGSLHALSFGVSTFGHNLSDTDSKIVWTKVLGISREQKSESEDVKATAYGMTIDPFRSVAFRRFRDEYLISERDEISISLHQWHDFPGSPRFNSRAQADLALHRICRSLEEAWEYRVAESYSISTALPAYVIQRRQRS